jgi:hypothetical protein
VALQENRTEHQKKSSRVIRPHVPGWDDDQRRIHRVKRRIRQAPWWLWGLTALLLAVSFFAAGWSWSSGRSSALAEQLTDAEAELQESETALVTAAAGQAAAETERTALSERIVELEQAIAVAPNQATVEELRTELAVSRQAVQELDEAIIGWQGQVEDLQTEIEGLHRDLRVEQARVRVQQNLAATGQAALAAEAESLPGRIADDLNANPPTVLAEYDIAVSQEILRESFGIRFGSINDETIAVTATGTAAFGLDGRATASGGNQIELGLPRLMVAGLGGFTPDSYDYQPGLLARVGDQDVSQLMVWVEANVLQPKACDDVASLRGLVVQTERRVQAAAGKHGVEVIWIDSAGRQFGGHQLTNTVLLSEAC